MTGGGFKQYVTKSGKAAAPAKASVTRLGACGLKIVVSASVANPLISVAPTIDYSYSIIIDGNNKKAMVSGSHDRFPWHEVIINGTQFVADGPSGPTKTPADLIFSMDVSTLIKSY